MAEKSPANMKSKREQAQSSQHFQNFKISSVASHIPYRVYYFHNNHALSQNICACADGMFEQERKTQYLQTPALERRTKRVIPGFRPVRSLLDAVGPSLLSATDLASRYGIEGEICRPLNPTPTHSSKPPLSI